MGNGMNKVLPGLYIGNFRDAKDEKQLKENNITHILAVHDNAKPVYDHLQYMCVDIADSPTENLLDHFKSCVNFIHKARTENGNVLVHCIAGISRSCTICAAYILVIKDIGWEDAISIVRYSRKVVNPNYGFQKQLQSFHVLDVIKVRENLIYHFGALNENDEKFMDDILRKYEREISGDESSQLSLGTTETFSNYERRKVTVMNEAIKSQFQT